MARNDFNGDLVRKLADLLDETGLTEIEYGDGTWHIRVARHTAPAAAQPAPAARAETPAAPAVEVPAPADRSQDPDAITSPMVGTVYMSPEPGAEPFVKHGDAVQQGQTLLLVEAMKTFNEIRAPKAGEVAEILVQDKMPVEYGDVLMIVR